MSLALGIDVGTTFTAAAAWRDGRAEVVALESHRVTVPTVLFADGDDMVFGTAAVARGATQPAGVGREFKRRLGDPVPIMLSGAPYSADRLVAVFARWVVDTVTEQLGEAPSSVVVTHPANWTEFQLHLLRSGLGQVGLGDAGLLTEPQAAAHDFGAAAHLTVGDVVLVYDLGGGTFDVALLRRDDTGFTHVGEPAGVERLGGIDFDEAVFQHVVAHLPPAVTEQASTEPAGRMALVQLRRACVEAKETLSSQVAVDIPVVLPGHSATVRLTRAELEGMIRPMLGQTIDLSRQVLTAAGYRPEQLSAILLVGGSSRIPLVSELVREEMGVPVRVDAHPKLVVARGAARWAGEHPHQLAAPAATARPPHKRRTLLLATGAAAIALAAAGGVWAATAGGDNNGDSTTADTTANSAANASQPTQLSSTPTPATTLNAPPSTAAGQPTVPPVSTEPPTSTAPPTTPNFPPAARVGSISSIGIAEIPPIEIDGHPVAAVTALTSDAERDRLIAISGTEEDGLEAAMFDVSVDLSDEQLDDGDVTFERPRTLIDDEGAPYSGDLDIEAMTLTSAGNILIASEGAVSDEFRSDSAEPFIHELDQDGRFVRDWPLPDWYLLDPDRRTGIQPDGGLASLATVDSNPQQVLMATAYPLYQDDNSPDSGEGQRARILAYDASTREWLAEYRYPLNPTTLNQTSPDGRPVRSGLIDFVAIEGTRTLITLERSLQEEPHRAQLYEVVLEPPAASAPSPATPTAVLSKRHLIDVDLGFEPMMRGNWHSLAWGPELSGGRRSLIVARDSNNESERPTWFQAFVLETTLEN